MIKAPKNNNQRPVIPKANGGLYNRYRDMHPEIKTEQISYVRRDKNGNPDGTVSWPIRSERLADALSAGEMSRNDLNRYDQCIQKAASDPGYHLTKEEETVVRSVLTTTSGSKAADLAIHYMTQDQNNEDRRKMMETLRREQEGRTRIMTDMDTGIYAASELSAMQRTGGMQSAYSDLQGQMYQDSLIRNEYAGIEESYRPTQKEAVQALTRMQSDDIPFRNLAPREQYAVRIYASPSDNQAIHTHTTGLDSVDADIRRREAERLSNRIQNMTPENSPAVRLTESMRTAERLCGADSAEQNRIMPQGITGVVASGAVAPDVMSRFAQNTSLLAGSGDRPATTYAALPETTREEYHAVLAAVSGSEQMAKQIESKLSSDDIAIRQQTANDLNHMMDMTVQTWSDHTVSEGTLYAMANPQQVASFQETANLLTNGRSEPVRYESLSRPVQDEFRSSLAAIMGSEQAASQVIANTSSPDMAVRQEALQTIQTKAEAFQQAASPARVESFRETAGLLAGTETKPATFSELSGKQQAEFRSSLATIMGSEQAASQVIANTSSPDMAVRQEALRTIQTKAEAFQQAASPARVESFRETAGLLAGTETKPATFASLSRDQQTEFQSSLPVIMGSEQAASKVMKDLSSPDMAVRSRALQTIQTKAEVFQQAASPARVESFRETAGLLAGTERKPATFASLSKERQDAFRSTLIATTGSKEKANRIIADLSSPDAKIRDQGVRALHKQVQTVCGWEEGKQAGTLTAMQAVVDGRDAAVLDAGLMRRLSELSFDGGERQMADRAIKKLKGAHGDLSVLTSGEKAALRAVLARNQTTAAGSAEISGMIHSISYENQLTDRETTVLEHAFANANKKEIHHNVANPGNAGQTGGPFGAGFNTKDAVRIIRNPKGKGFDFHVRTNGTEVSFEDWMLDPKSRSKVLAAWEKAGGVSSGLTRGVMIQTPLNLIRQTDVGSAIYQANAWVGPWAKIGNALIIRGVSKAYFAHNMTRMKDLTDTELRILGLTRDRIGGIGDSRNLAKISRGLLRDFRSGTLKAKFDEAVRAGLISPDQEKAFWKTVKRLIRGGYGGERFDIRLSKLRNVSVFRIFAPANNIVKSKLRSSTTVQALETYQQMGRAVLMALKAELMLTAFAGNVGMYAAEGIHMLANGAIGGVAAGASKAASALGQSKFGASASKFAKDRFASAKSHKVLETGRGIKKKVKGFRQKLSPRYWMRQLANRMKQMIQATQAYQTVHNAIQGLKVVQGFQKIMSAVGAVLGVLSTIGFILFAVIGVSLMIILLQAINAFFNTSDTEIDALDKATVYAVKQINKNQSKFNSTLKSRASTYDKVTFTYLPPDVNMEMYPGSDDSVYMTDDDLVSTDGVKVVNGESINGDAVTLDGMTMLTPSSYSFTLGGFDGGKTVGSYQDGASGIYAYCMVESYLGVSTSADPNAVLSWANTSDYFDDQTEGKFKAKLFTESGDKKAINAVSTSTDIGQITAALKNSQPVIIATTNANFKPGTSKDDTPIYLVLDGITENGNILYENPMWGSADGNGVNPAELVSGITEAYIYPNKKGEVLANTSATTSTENLSNGREILTMANVYYNFDLAAAKNNDKLKLKDYIKRLFNASHPTDTDVTTEYWNDNCATKQVTDEKGTHTVYYCKGHQVAYISIHTYYFDKIFKCSLTQSDINADLNLIWWCRMESSVWGETFDDGKHGPGTSGPFAIEISGNTNRDFAIGFYQATISTVPQSVCGDGGFLQLVYNYDPSTFSALEPYINLPDPKGQLWANGTGQETSTFKSLESIWHGYYTQGLAGELISAEIQAYVTQYLTPAEEAIKAKTGIDTTKCNSIVRGEIGSFAVRWGPESPAVNIAKYSLDAFKKAYDANDDDAMLDAICDAEMAYKGSDIDYRVRIEGGVVGTHAANDTRGERKIGHLLLSGDETVANLLGISQEMADSIGTGSGDGTISGNGAPIVEEALKYVGNPYVHGGDSLTNGIDCSHFVWEVLKRSIGYTGGYVTSTNWASKGTAVDSLADAQAGDIIVYSGHVAIYDGNGMIVEAKGAKWGITHDRRADHAPILAIRRFV